MRFEPPPLVIKRLGEVEYLPTLEAMRAFTENRGTDTADELWVLEHPPVYTLGVRSDPRHQPSAGNGIPIVRGNRGGEITYHGPGQAIVYTLVDLGRRALTVREFVRMLEQSVIDLLADGGVTATRRAGAPGVYVGEAKIAALGLRVSRGRAYHGIALNVDMDLSPFLAIDPCGFPGLSVTQTRDLGVAGSAHTMGERLAATLARKLGHA
ncbi:MAG TPA: lipoyl(octanoyl) transferase LipB [Burkholderiales bacterium]|jgi:lipoyl(octanoyl) transferase|nr:lipoyl(octanoyl) transferase LipB [Burkholderiales bacterium]